MSASPNASSHRHRVHLFGSFEVTRDGVPLEGFESQKVRALCAYLLCHPHHMQSRDHLAGLLWPDKTQESARRNLRQALYNLRSVLADAGWETESDHQSISLAPPEGTGVDIHEFERQAQRGLGGTEPDVEALHQASVCYRGPFLADLQLRDETPFDEWRLSQQRRFQELAMQLDKTLGDHFLNRGEHERAMHHARRVLQMDPLAEPAHRDLMRLFAVSGRRTQALAQFEQLSKLLQRELGVKPDRRTLEIYRSILAEEVPATLIQHTRGPTGPVVPLVARGRASIELRDSWQQTLRDGARVAVVVGEAGVGKTRLVRTFLHTNVSRARPRVLLGTNVGGAMPRPLAPFPDLLLHAVADRVPSRVDEPVGSLPHLLAQVDEALPGSEEAGAGHDVADLLARLLRTQHHPSGKPSVLFLDDFHHASGAAVEVLRRTLELVRDLPVWTVATVPEPELADRLEEELPVPVDRIRLYRVGDEACTEIARQISADDATRDALARLLTLRGCGLPLQTVEVINLLWDEGLLQGEPDGQWSLTEAVDPEVVPEELPALLLRRLDFLPTSARRLTSIAAVFGERFDVELLQKAAKEHMAVVEIGIELLLERWLVRQHSRHWATHPRERDLVLWAHGTRRGYFEFSHPSLRQTLYDSLPAERQRQIHRGIAQAYADEEGRAPWSEQRAYHWLAAGAIEEARVHADDAVRNALRLGDPTTARRFETSAHPAHAASS
jgi:DNA-binding SARP family transcriptional activator